MSDNETDYTPRASGSRKERGKSAPPSHPHGQGQATEDYTPRPVRRSRPAPGEKESYSPRPVRQERGARETPQSYVPRPARREPARRSGKRGRFLGSKLFWRLAAVAGLIVLIGVPLLADLIQRESVPSLDDLVKTGNQFYDQGLQFANAGNNAQALSSFEQAASYYEQALSQNPDDTDVRTDLGTMYRYQGLLRGDPALIQKAMLAWNDVLALDPNKVEALFNLGLAYADLGQNEEAVTIWQRVIELAPGSPTAQDAQDLIQQYEAPY